MDCAVVCKCEAELNCLKIIERLRTMFGRDFKDCENPTVGHVMKPSSI